MQDELCHVDSHGLQLACRRQPGSTPGVLFLGGFRSDMNGTKAQALATFCARQEIDCTRFDYRGHGQSAGSFEQATISDWLNDALTVIDECTHGPLVLVGSSMGGWLMLLSALARPQRVAALLGIATATDMTEALLWQGLDADHRRGLREHGSTRLPDHYGDSPCTIRWPLIEDGRRHLLLGDRIPISCPVRLLHGDDDEDVPWQLSQRLLEQLDSDDARLHLVKHADHRFSNPRNLALILDTLTELRTLTR